MFSLTRFLVIVGIYVAFVLVISLTLPTTNPSLFVILLLVALGALFYVLFLPETCWLTQSASVSWL